MLPLQTTSSSAICRSKLDDSLTFRVCSDRAGAVNFGQKGCLRDHHKSRPFRRFALPQAFTNSGTFSELTEKMARESIKKNTLVMAGLVPLEH